MQPKPRRLWKQAQGLLLLTAVLLAPAVLLSACTGDSDTTGSATTSSTASPSTASTATVTSDDPSSTTAPPVVMTEEAKRYTQEMKKTAAYAAELGAKLEAQGVAADQPEAAPVLLLRARVQAIEARKFLSEGQLPAADAAVKEMRSLLSRVKAVANGDMLTLAERALADVEALSLPSKMPEEAKEPLDKLMATLAVLLPADTAPDADDTASTGFTQTG